MRPKRYQRTFNPGHTDKPVDIDLFDQSGKPVLIRVTVPSCDDESREELVSMTGELRKVLLLPGGWAEIRELVDAEDRPVSLSLRAKECPPESSDDDRVDVELEKPDVRSDMRIGIAAPEAG